ncbi:hypothetical protein Q8G35_23645 [Peribacillus simplex]|uniref:Uncharacterized protein n=2 Tax=Peribacillus TaxID=2675229 RepID=A0AA90PIG1_9BACI|nr:MULTISPECIES: hypothetical protein [Peribacillus]MDP1421285.1 hypothetical protein [Peribacillus simplex]MDP1452980.1 hypothetical protein [Peribacillus frigoritolerans]
MTGLAIKPRSIAEIRNKSHSELEVVTRVQFHPEDVCFAPRRYKS